MTDPKDQANELAAKASELNGDDRRLFLETECSDLDVRSLVVSILATLDHASSSGGSIGSKTGSKTRSSKPPTVGLNNVASETSADLGQVGGYRLIEVLGQGGMGTVYKAKQEHPVKRTVALKVIRAGLNSADVISRFESERQALAIMDHPSIARVLDVGETEQGLPFFAMELVQGKPLTDYILENNLTLREKLALFKEVCLAVEHAHQKGVIHRDLKPSNILVAKLDGVAVPKIIDFGLAKALTNSEMEDLSLTRLGGVMGTVQYMSPEQASGFNQDIDTRTDIYSLGVILYELLSGSTPLTTDDLQRVSFPERLKMIQEEEPAVPSSRLSLLAKTASSQSTKGHGLLRSQVRSIQGDLDWIVMKSIDKDRARRYSSAGNLADEIQRYLLDLPVQASPPSRRYRLLKFARRNKVLFSMMAVVATTLCIAFVGITVGFVSASIARKNALDSKEAEKAQRINAEAAYASERKALSQTEATVSELFLSRGEMALESELPGTAALWYTNAAALPSKSESDRKFHLIQAKNAIQQTVLPVSTFDLQSRPTKVEFSKSGKFLAAIGTNKKLKLFDWQTMRSLERTEQLGDVTSFDWHPTQDIIAIAIEKPKLSTLVYIWNCQTEESIHSFICDEVKSTVRFSPDGKFLACAEKSIQIWDVDQKNPLDRTYVSTKKILNLSWSPDGKKIVLGEDDYRASLIDVFGASGPVQGISLPHQAAVPINGGMCLPQWSNDSQVLVVGNLSKKGGVRIQLLDATSAELNVKHSIDIATNFLNDLSLSADGSTIAIAGYLAAYAVQLGDANQKPMRIPFLNQVLKVRFIGSSNDFVAVGRSSEARIIRNVTSHISQARLPHFGIVSLCDCHPDGVHLVTSHDSGMTILWRDSRPISLKSSFAKWGPNAKLSMDGSMLVPSPWHESPGNPITFELKDMGSFDVSNMQHVKWSQKLQGSFQAAAINRDGTLAALAYTEGSNTHLCMIDAKTGEIRNPPLPMKGGTIASMAFSPNSNDLAILHSKGILGMIKADTGELGSHLVLPNWETPNVTSMIHRVQFAEKGTSIVVVSPGNHSYVHVIDAKTLKPRYEPIRPVLEGYFCRSIALSNSEDFLATVVVGKNAVRIWDLRNGVEVIKPILHPGDFIGIFRVAFRPDDLQLLTSNFDGYVRQFDSLTGNPCGPSLKHPDEVFDAQYVHDGKYACTACRDGYWRLWDLKSGKLVTAPIQLGDGPERGAPTNLHVINDKKLCIATGDQGEFYAIDMSPFLAELDLRVDDYRKLTELASGQTISFGNLTGLDLSDWKSRWSDTQRILDSHIRETPIDEIEAIVRSERIVEQQSNTDVQLALLRQILGKVRELPETNADKLWFYASTVNRAIKILRKQEKSNGVRSFLEWKKEANSLLEKMELQIENGNSVSPKLAEEVAEAWFLANAPQWTPWIPNRLRSDEGTELTSLEDHSITATGPNPKMETYRCDFRISKGPIHALKLDVVSENQTSPSGNGRDSFGNFYLTFLGIRRQLGVESPSLNVHDLFFSWAPPGFAGLNLVSENNLQGWHTFGQQNRDHWAILGLLPTDETQNIPNELMASLELQFRGSYPQTSFRRFRVSSSDDMNAFQLELMQAPYRDQAIRNELLLAYAFLLNNKPNIAIGLLDGNLEKTPRPLAAAVFLKALALFRLNKKEEAVEMIKNAFNSVGWSSGHYISKALVRLVTREVMNWDTLQIESALRNYDRSFTLDNFSRFVNASPNDAYLREVRAKWLETHQMWSLALIDRQKIYDLQRDDRIRALQVAPILVLANPEKYPMFAKTIMQRYANSKDGGERETAIKIACVLPEIPGVESLDSQYLEDQLSSKDAKAIHEQYVYTAMAFHNLRKHEPKLAIEWCKKALSISLSDEVKGQVLTIAALAYLESNERELANESMAEFNRISPGRILQFLPEKLSDAIPMINENPTHDYLISEILRREFYRKIEER